MGRKVEYWSRSQSSKFIGQVIEINEFYHRKYLTKLPLGDYYTFPEIDDEGCVEFSYMRAFGDGPRNFEPWSSDVDDTLGGTPSLNYYTTPTEGRFSSRQI
ncbi:hypothetical protein TNCV_4623671 [Trichonephila clavipes]|nr:hypothetical protein TNCV_4623671 [Trichonephila clavipes]